MVSPASLTVVSPNSVTFTCNATAKPRASIQWIRNGNVLNTTMDTAKITITDSTQGDCIITNPPSECLITSILEITDSVPNDSGEYVCTAFNPAGNDTTFVILMVNGKYGPKSKFVHF